MLSMFSRLANPYESPSRHRRRLSAVHIMGGFIVGAAVAAFLVRHPDPSAAFADWHVGTPDKNASPTQVVALHSAVTTDASPASAPAKAAPAEEILPPAPEITAQPAPPPETGVQTAEAPTGAVTAKRASDSTDAAAAAKPKHEAAKEAKKAAPKPVRTAQNHKTRRPPRAEFVETFEGRRLVYRAPRDADDDDDFSFGGWNGYRQRSLFPTFD